MALAGTYLALGCVAEHLAAARVEDALGLPARARFPGFHKVRSLIPMQEPCTRVLQCRNAALVQGTRRGLACGACHLKTQNETAMCSQQFDSQPCMVDEATQNRFTRFQPAPRKLVAPA